MDVILKVEPDKIIPSSSLTPTKHLAPIVDTKITINAVVNNSELLRYVTDSNAIISLNSVTKVKKELLPAGLATNKYYIPHNNSQTNWVLSLRKRLYYR